MFSKGEERLQMRDILGLSLMTGGERAGARGFTPLLPLESKRRTRKILQFPFF